MYDVQTETMEEINKKPKVLIVDDDKISQILLSLSFETLSDNIKCESDGLDAIKTIRENPDIDLIMMDINMYDIDGYEAVRQIRQFNKDVIIIAQTATDLSLDRENAILSGFNDFVLKPVKTEAISCLIKKHFHWQTANYHA
jgi:CheY-like chemotaxis protein